MWSNWLKFCITDWKFEPLTENIVEPTFTDWKFCTIEFKILNHWLKVL